MPRAIIMSEEEKQKWRIVLYEHYRQRGTEESALENIVEAVFTDCQMGWERAPKNIDKRIKMKTGFQWRSFENLRPRKAKGESDEKPEDLRLESTNSIFDCMTKEENSWWKERMDIYRKDFEFNESSDKPLLEQLLVEELIQKRLFRDQIRYPNKDYNKKMNDGLKRIADIQIRLGITREQRAGMMNKIDGNIAQISVNLNEKLAVMPEKIQRQYEEELYFTNLRNQRPPVNILPPMEKLEALLKIDGKISANVDSEKFAQITEDVAREITEKRSELQEKPKELPSEGIEI